MIYNIAKICEISINQINIKGKTTEKLGIIGKEKAKQDNSSNRLVPLIIQTNDIDVTNNEAVMKGDNSIGYITSGGFAHFVNKSVAFSYLDQKNLSSEDGIQVEINGDLFNCSIIKEPLYDPSGEKMRG